MANEVGMLSLGDNGYSLAISTASAVTTVKFNGAVSMAVVGTNCYVRQGSSAASASSGSTASVCDQFLIAGMHKFTVAGYIAAQASSGTGVVYITPTSA